MFVIVFTSRAKRSLKKHKRSGSFPREKLVIALDMLRKGERLPISYQDHILQGELTDMREFHLGYDLLVQYARNEVLRTITVAAIGTHNELFGN